MTDVDRMLCRDATQRIDDGPSDREGPPTDYNRRKHPLGGMESVLSASEEDLHLESINTFFERQGRLAGPEGATEPRRERLEDQGEVILEKELCSPGRQASGCYLPETVAVFNSLAARSEAGLGSTATQTARGTININTMNKAGADLETTPEGADGSSRAETNKLTNPETELLIKEDRLMTTAKHELRQRSRYRGESDDFICLEDTLGSDQARSLEMCKRRHDAEYEQPSLNMETLSSIVGAAVVDGLQKANINLLLPGLDPNSQHRNAGKDLPRSDYNRKKRKKKKRFSALLDKREARGQLSTESEELPSAQRTGMDPCLSRNQSEVRGSEKTISGCVFAGLLPNTHVTQTSSCIENPSDSLHASTPPSDNQHRHVQDNPESAPVSAQPYNTPRSPPANISVHKSFSTSDPADDRLAPSATVGANVGTHLQARGVSWQNKPTGPTLTLGSPTLASACERSILSGDESDAGHMGTLQQLYEKKHSFTNTSGKSGGKSDLYAAEVKSTTKGVPQGGDSNGPTKDTNQRDEEANREEAHLAGGEGFSGGQDSTECPRGSQKLEIDGHKVTIPLSSTHLPRSTIVLIASDAQGMAKELETGLSSVLVENPVEGHLSLDPVKGSPDAEGTTPNNQLVTIPKVSVFSGNTSTQVIQPPVPHISPVLSCDTSPCQSEEISSNTAALTQSYGCLFSTEPSKKELTITDMSDNSPQVVDMDKRVTNDVERHETSQDTSDDKCLQEGPPMTSETAGDVNKAPDCENKVFAMSSFWDEMERLTIKDILGLRMAARTPPPQFLLPLAESEETDNNDTTDSGYFTPQLEALSTVPDLEHVGSLASKHDASSSSPGIMWDGEPSQVSLGAGINCEYTRLTSDPDELQALLSSSSEERHHRQMFKNTSVQNLHAMGSEQFSRTRRVHTMAAVIPEESGSEKDWFAGVQTPFSDRGTDGSSSLFTEGTPAEGYRISLTDIFRSLFGGKQSNPKPPDPEDTGTYYSCGNTVPENYDQFFSEFDLGSFFYPLLEADDHPKDELVPIFSRSRSASRYLQYPEAYDHFLSSSSSDGDSSAESEEEGEGPIRVVTRFSHRAAESPTSTDIYENFFADLDVHDSLFWNTTFSLRNFRLTGPLSRRQQRAGPLTPLHQGSVQRPRQVFSINALGSQDSLAPGPGLYHFEERIYRQPNPFSLDDLQLAVSHQSLGASLVPLRQSDMCLVCIAFASWVLKSANPDVGDAWKAVVLANISALSAIGYLRKYMRGRSLDQPATRSPTI